MKLRLYKNSPFDDNIISVLLKAGLSDEEVLSTSLLVFIAGSGTTASLISLGIRSNIIEKTIPSKDLADQILFRSSPLNSAFPRYAHKDYILNGTSLKRMTF